MEVYQSGQFTIKSAYAVEKDEGQQKQRIGARGHYESTSYPQNQSKIWKSSWSLQMKHKLKHFVWRCLLHSLPVNEQIHQRTGQRSGMCDCCGEEVETVEHMLFFCASAALTWKITPLQWDGLNDMRSNFVRWWEGLLEARKREMGLEHISLTVNIL